MHCPITFKEFTRHSHIVAVATSGNVYAPPPQLHNHFPVSNHLDSLAPHLTPHTSHSYSFDAVEELNIKARNFTDLLTGQPFTRADIITLQDPSDMTKLEIATFVP